MVAMGRQDTLQEIERMMGSVPGWLAALPDGQLERRWADMMWMNGDTGLTSREKKLVAFGAAVAIHCSY